MLMIQADNINGVYEVADSFDAGVSVFDFDDFMSALPKVLEGETIGCATSDPVQIELLESEYGIHRISL